jgi:hypothetical protein
VPDPRFIGLVHSLRSSAEAALGELSSPMVTRLARDGALARRTAERSLDLLEMLVDKTHGRLDATERDALLHARDEVRRRLAATAVDAPEHAATAVDAPDPGADGDEDG